MGGNSGSAGRNLDISRSPVRLQHLLTLALQPLAVAPPHDDLGVMDEPVDLKGTETLITTSCSEFVLVNEATRTSRRLTHPRSESGAGGFGGASGARRPRPRCGRLAL